MIRSRVLGAALAFAALSGAASAQAPSAAQGWFPAHRKLVWKYAGELGEKRFAFAVRATATPEKVRDREAFALETVSFSRPERLIAVEHFAFDGSRVLLVRQRSGEDPARDLDPPQPFLDVEQLRDGGRWAWTSKDGSESVEASFARTETLRGTAGRAHACAVVESTLTVRGGADRAVVREQRRTLWLERGLGIVREVTVSGGPGARGGELRCDVGLASIESGE